eukprot:CAMPEP_0201628018 /NCGR_PEP_ID=MMETSP0493-20130528/3084_1 /ASSEMBLY_ACC=CAM_ASM_000838 /TAXON_ID=420259 /ORGANISM="Thalassiosira gravida, Strain GMp14c1" /LENGTH=57 /DNA_ID=CAMNT_0048098659 /DNA_START=12 /DNA_END=182 /DNA_ORIENTATION=+
MAAVGPIGRLLWTTESAVRRCSPLCVVIVTLHDRDALTIMAAMTPIDALITVRVTSE